MKPTIVNNFILLLFIAVVACGCEKPVEKVQAATRPKWEYKTVEVENYAFAEYSKKLEEYAKKPTRTEDERRDLKIAETIAGGFTIPGLYELGEEGWELVSCVATVDTEWPKVRTGSRYDRDRDKLVDVEETQPNIRSGKLLLIFKRQK